MLNKTRVSEASKDTTSYGPCNTFGHPHNLPQIDFPTPSVKTNMSQFYWNFVSLLHWANPAAPAASTWFFGISDFRFSIFSFCQILSGNMLVGYRRINKKGVLERPWTESRVLSTLKFQFTVKYWKMDFLMPCKTTSCQNSGKKLRMLRAPLLDAPRPPRFSWGGGLPPPPHPPTIFVGLRPPRKSMENPWVPMGSHGSPWVPMGSHGSPWVPWDPMGSEWGTHGLHGKSKTLGNFRSGSMVWELSLGSARLGSWAPGAGGTGRMRRGEPLGRSWGDSGGSVCLPGH